MPSPCGWSAWAKGKELCHGKAKNPRGQASDRTSFLTRVRRVLRRYQPRKSRKPPCGHGMGWRKIPAVLDRINMIDRIWESVEPFRGLPSVSEACLRKSVVRVLPTGLLVVQWTPYRQTSRGRRSTPHVANTIGLICSGVDSPVWMRLVWGQRGRCG